MVETVDITERIAERRRQTKRELREEGLHLPRRPKYDIPRLPLAITELPDDELMQLMVGLTRYQDHIAGQLVEAEVDEQTAESALELAKAKGVIANWGGGSDARVTISKAQTQADPTVIELTNVWQVKKARRKMLGVMIDSMARDAGVVSRELSRRIGREPHERRSDRWSS